MDDTGDRGGSSGGDGRRKSNYERFTAQQNQSLEGVFNECSHPDDIVRKQLSGELGLSPLQIKYWFQNKRTQLRAQNQKADNSILRAENERIRNEIVVIKEVLKNAVCTSCRGPDQLREENAHLREELKRLANITKYMERPLSQLHLDKSLMIHISRNAMEELIKLLQSDSPFWMRSSADGREVLNPGVHESIFTGVAKSPNVRIESSKDSGVVIIHNCLDLVDIFMDANKWMEFLPNIVMRALTIDVISAGLMGSKNGLLQMMYEELQVLSPLVPTREFFFLRFCQQIEENAWAIVDFPYDFPQGPSSNSRSPVRRLPSGCLIQDMLNGHSKITWMEHTEIEDFKPIHNLHMKHICSGLAFGATRKIATLQRTCERLTFLMDASNTSDLGGVITSCHGKRGLMKLSQRMVKNFCSSINIFNGQQVMISRMNDVEVRTTLQKCTDPGHPDITVLSATTTIPVSFASVKVFDFFRDERNRPIWDVLSNHNPVQKVGHIACGSHPGNCISVLGALDTSQSNKLILQESCIDSSGALIVYCPVDLHAINMAMSSEDPLFIPTLSSGFAISPDAGENLGPGEMSAGSLVTIVVRIIVSNLTSGEMSLELVNTVHYLVNTVKAALNCSSC